MRAVDMAIHARMIRLATQALAEQTIVDREVAITMRDPVWQAVAFSYPAPR